MAFVFSEPHGGLEVEVVVGEHYSGLGRVVGRDLHKLRMCNVIG